MRKGILKKILSLWLVIAMTVCTSSSLLTSVSYADEGDDYTYSTAGDDSANYIDGDKSGTKSVWEKNGDVWTYTFYVDDPNAQWYVWEDSSTLMEGYTGDYTEYNVGQTFTTEELTEFTKEDKMEESVNSSGKKVYTWLDSSYSYKVVDNGDGTFTKTKTALSFTITNYESNSEDPVKYGQLEILKVVTNSEGEELTDDETAFGFDIKLEGDKISGDQTFGDYVFVDGVAKIKLKAGETVLIDKIPEGTTYTVDEVSVKGYEATCQSNTGTIEKDSTASVVYINVKDDTKPEYVDLTVAKEVVGYYESVDDEYTIMVSLTGLQENAMYLLSNGGSFTADKNGLADVELKLKKDESVTIKDIPVGTRYQASEAAGDYLSSYSITDAANKGSINTTNGRSNSENQSLATAIETADSGEKVTIKYTNETTRTEDIVLKKVVTDEENTESYTFDITFGNMQEGYSFNTTAGKVTAESDGTATLSVYLAGGQELEMYNVPVGTTYTITEQASNAVASYEITDANGKGQIVQASGANEKNKTALTTATETVNEGESITITYTNDIPEESEPDVVTENIEITKVVTNENGEVLEANVPDKFKFTIEANEEGNPMPTKSEIEIIGQGTAVFEGIEFTETGTYSYTIKETAESENEDYTYDDKSYVITYEVIKVEGLLKATKTMKRDGFIVENVEFTNVKTTTEEEKEISIAKVDENGEVVEGAKLQILDSENNIVADFTTTKEAYKVLLTEGQTYTLHEVAAPGLYVITEDVEFTVSAEEETQTVEMKDPTNTEFKKESYYNGEAHSGGDIKAGEELTYKITFTNKSGADNTYEIVDALPENTTFVSADNDGKCEDNKVTWNVEIKADEEKTVSFVVKVGEEAYEKTLTNKATITSDNKTLESNPVENPVTEKPEEPVTPEEPEEPDEPEEPKEEKPKKEETKEEEPKQEEPKQEEKKPQVKGVTEKIGEIVKTGDSILECVIILFVLAGIVLMIEVKLNHDEKKKKNK